MSDPVFVFQLDATATAASGSKAGDRHALMAFARGADAAAAEAAARAGLAAEGWTDPELKQSAQLRREGLPEQFQAPAAEARANGFALLVYQPPIGPK